MFCPQCGSENKDASQFCTNCGSSLAAAAKVLEKVRADEAREAGEVVSVEAESGDAEAADAQVAREDGEPATDETPQAEAVAVDDPLGDDSSEPGESKEVGESESQDDAESNAADALDGVAEAAEADEPSDGEGRQSDAVADESDTPAGVTEPLSVLAAEAPAAAKPKDRRPFYVAGIAVGLILIGILSYQLFFNRTGGDIVTYGQIEPVYIDADTTITPKGSDGKELDSYEVTLSNSKGTAASARVKGSGGFNVKHLKKASKLKSGSYTVRIYDRTTKVEWTLPVKFAPKKKKASTAVTIEVADQSESSKKSDDESSDSTTSDTVYALYYQKVQEYLAIYGEPSIVAGTGNCRSISGLAYARLIDFDDDGTDELYLIYSTKSKNDLASASTLVNEIYASEVWAYRDGGLKRVHKNTDTDSVSIVDDGSCSSPLYKDGDRYALLESYMDGDYVGFAYKELKNDSFVTKKSYVLTGNGMDAGILINGKKANESALAELTSEFGGSGEPLYVGFHGLNDASLETTLEATQKVFAQLKSSTTSASKKSSKTKASSSKSTKAQNKKAHAAYQEVFKQYREAFAAAIDPGLGVDDDEPSYYDERKGVYWTDSRKNCKYPFVSSTTLIDLTQSFAGTIDGARYLYKDLNGDGVDELLMAMTSEYETTASKAIFAVYGCVDGEVKGLLEGNGYRAWVYLCEDNILCDYGNGGWVSNVWEYQAFDGTLMNEVESLVQDYDDSDLHTATTKYTKGDELVESASDSLEDMKNSYNLTKNKALIEKVQATHPIDTSVTWKKLPE